MTVHLSDADAPWTGAISCDDTDKIYTDKLPRDYGALQASCGYTASDAATRHNVRCAPGADGHRCGVVPSLAPSGGCRRVLSPLTSATTSADRGVIRTDMRSEDLAPPPDLANKSIRFSDDFHPLDHRFGDRRCRQLQRLRGHYLHAKLQWQYGPAGDRVRTPLHRYTTCVIGQHHYSTAWRRNEDEWVFLHRRCTWCRRDDPDLITHERID